MPLNEVSTLPNALLHYQRGGVSAIFLTKTFLRHSFRRFVIFIITKYLMFENSLFIFYYIFSDFYKVQLMYTDTFYSKHKAEGEGGNNFRLLMQACLTLPKVIASLPLLGLSINLTLRYH